MSARKLPLPNTQEIQTAIQKLKQFDPLKKRKILLAKVEVGLNAWAITQMGAFEETGREENIRQYFKEALINFYSQVALRVAKEPDLDPLKAMQETSFLFPFLLRDKKGLSFDPYQMLKEYEEILFRVREYKKKKWKVSRNKEEGRREFGKIPKYKAEALKGILPGLPWKLAWEWRNMDASDIAYEYLAHKHELKIKGEALKKHLTLAKNPEMMVGEILKEIVKSSIPPMIVKPTRKT